MTEEITYAGWTITSYPVMKDGVAYEAKTSNCTCHESQTFEGKTRQEAITLAKAWCDENIPF